MRVPQRGGAKRGMKTSDGVERGGGEEKRLQHGAEFLNWRALYQLPACERRRRVQIKRGEAF